MAFLHSRLLQTVGCLAIASGLWLPAVHLVFRWRAQEVRIPIENSQSAMEMAEQQFSVWQSQGADVEQTNGSGLAISKMRATNPEWDFMARTYFVLSSANMALRDPSKTAMFVERMDVVIDQTLALEQRYGHKYFLLDYANASPFSSPTSRSIFVDGEIALMLAARRTVLNDTKYTAILTQRIDGLVSQMAEGPVQCGESYPDECWMFCNTVALAAIRIADFLDGSDHSDFIAKWLRMAKQTLIDPATGLLVSSFHLDGRVKDGPEGSSIWMSAHCLQLVDPDFARGQYALAKKHLAGSFLGFGFAREWAESGPKHQDVDSGPVVPLLGASPGSSGLALLAAAAFSDDEYFAQLSTALEFAGFPLRARGTLRFAAGNQVGDAAALYSMVLGPLWNKVLANTGVQGQ
jgi:hypothetical protein